MATDVGRSAAEAASGCQPTASAAISGASSLSGIPNAATLAAELEALIAVATDEDLDDRGRYFCESFCDLTQCGHGDTGEYRNPKDGRLVELLWNNRRLFVSALTAIADAEQVSA